jgi:hypothetical protein
LAAGWLALVLRGCGGEVPVAAPHATILLSPEGNRLNAYDTTTLREQTVVQNHALDPSGRDINGQVCVFPDGSRRFVAGEDTGQPERPQGFGVFQLHGDQVGRLSAVQTGKLVPTYQDSLLVADNYGCGFLRDGRLLTTDIGRNRSGPGTGQLIVWFPPFEVPQPRHCKLDIAIATAGGIAVDADDRIYVASARLEVGIYRYTGPFPTSDDAAGGCGQRDGTGAPMADAIRKELFIAKDRNLPTPNAVVQSGRGTFYVSSVLNGVIAEYDADGKFVRRIVEPIRGEFRPFPSTGTPLGLAVGADGTLYYADLALTLAFEPGDGLGTVRRVRFENGEPLPPDTIDTGLDFPDGLGLFEP